MRADPACGRRSSSLLEAILSTRERRVTLLIIGVIALSLGDLAVTLTHLKTIGMVEANPIAAFLIRATDSPWALSAFKALTVAVCVSLLYRLRSHREGEIAAWCAIGILIFMSVRWHQYAMEIESPARVLIAQLDENWQFLD